MRTKVGFKNMKRSLFCCGMVLAAWFLAFFINSPSGYAEETIKIKILAVNPSATKSLKTTVAQYLPQEVTPDDVLDKEGLEIKYDTEKRTYAILKEVELAPNETQTIEVRVRNVWVISPEQIEEVKTQLKQSAEALKRTKFAATGKLLYEKATEALAQIEEDQTKSLGIMQRMNLYRMNVRQLDDLRQNALSLEAMRKMEEEKKSGVRQVKFVVSAENPASTEKKLQVRSELPSDIKESDIIDKGEFDLIFDEKKSSYLLQREDTLGPNEVKKYEITIRDIWYIPQSELDFLKNELEKLVPLFVKSPYEEFSIKQKAIVLKAIQAIEALQAEVTSSNSIDDRIRAHVLNDQRFKSAKRKIKELQDLLSEVALKPNEPDRPRPLDNLIHKIIDVKNKVLVAMGLNPNKSFMWWVLLGIVLFLALITVVFYGTWLKKLQDTKTGASSKKTQNKPQSESRS